MGLKSIAALLAATVPLVLTAQTTPPDTAAQPVTPAPYTPHKTPLGKKKIDKAKVSSAPKKPMPPKPPARPSPPPYLYDKQGNAIPTSPDAYDVSTATRKK